MTTCAGQGHPRLFDAVVVDNTKLCREHYRLVLSGRGMDGARPGQFLHLAPCPMHLVSDASADGAWRMSAGRVSVPMLRRAFSIAGLRRRSDGSQEANVIYRVVGAATRWMASLRAGDLVSAIGPVGNAFPIRKSKPNAWLVGGGVGLPPLLWLAEALHEARRSTVAFLGARSADLLPVSISDPEVLSRDASRAVRAVQEFAASDTPVIISTDDGSLGFHGHAVDAMLAHFETTRASPDELVVYTCGPELMMATLARFCLSRSIECYVCMERAMACGMGTCQSCVVPVKDADATDGWRYELCCTQGPVFDASRVIWSENPGGGVQQ